MVGARQNRTSLSENTGIAALISIRFKNFAAFFPWCNAHSSPLCFGTKRSSVTCSRLNSPCEFF